MKTIRPSWRQSLRKFVARLRFRAGLPIKLNDADIEQGTYKEYLGGGAEHWQRRGEFQLHFLKAMGMQPSNKLLDIGCGPGRASDHLVEYLDVHNYHGIDHNADYVRAARLSAEAANLTAKQPTFEVIKNFDFRPLEPVFNYALVFSVLNNCPEDARRAFFRMIAQPLAADAKVFLSHGHWCEESYLENSGMELARTYTADDFDITEFGWKKRDSIFPLLELAVCRKPDG